MNTKLKKIRILSLLASFVVIAALLAQTVYQQQRKSFLEGVHERIFTAAKMLESRLGTSFKDQISKERELPQKTYLEMVQQNNRACQSLDLQYIWSVIKIESQVYFTSATSTSHDSAQGDHAAYLEKHNNPEAFDEAFAKMQPHYSTFKNEWGTGYMVLVPSLDQKGRKHAFGASMHPSKVELLFHSQMKSFLQQYFIWLLVFLVIGAEFLSRIFTKIYSLMDQSSSRRSAIRELLELAANKLGSGMWAYDCKHQRIYLSPPLKKLFKLDSWELSVEEFASPLSAASQRTFLSLFDERIEDLSQKQTKESKLKPYTAILDLKNQNEKFSMTIYSPTTNDDHSFLWGNFNGINEEGFRHFEWFSIEKILKQFDLHAFILSQDFEFIFKNSKWKSIDPDSPSLEMLFKTGLLPDHQESYADIQSQLESGQAWNGTLAVKSAPHQSTYLKGTIIKNDGASLGGFTGIFEDVSPLERLSQKYKKIIDSNPCFLLVIDKNFIIQEEYNHDLEGVSYQGRNMLELATSENREKIKQACEKALAGETAELYYESGGGSRSRYYHVFYRPLGTGEILVAASNITEREVLLRRNEALVREVHHRVKNNFQMIASFIQLYAFEKKNQDSSLALEEVQERIAALSKMHEMLVKPIKVLSNSHPKAQGSKLTSGFFEEQTGVNAYLMNFSSHYSPIQDLRACEFVSLSSNQDQDFLLQDHNQYIYLCLIFHELIANSIKHSSPSKDSLKIYYGCFLIDQHCYFVYRDSGSGFSESFSKEGFGSKLISIMVDSLEGHQLAFADAPKEVKQSISSSMSGFYTIRFSNEAD